jgi:hypothetical protein
MLRTEPPGATCSVLRGGEVVAAVEVTPDYARVPRRNEPIEVVCRKGNLEQRMTFDAVPAHEVPEGRASTRECAPRENSAGELAGGLALTALVEAPLLLFPPASIALVAVGVAAAATAEPRYAVRQPPEFLLAPVTFDSEPACDAHFAALKARLEAEADAQLAQVNQSCHPWPCTAADAVCPSTSCELPRTRIAADLKNRLDQIPGLRERARIVPR